MNITELLTKSNIRILKLINEEPSHIRDIADKLKISPAKVQQAVNLFRKQGIVAEKKYKNRITIAPNAQSILLQKIKALINYSELESSQNFKKLGEAGVYGSFNSGKDDKNSDIDIFVITEKKEIELIPTIRILEKELRKKVNLLVLNKQKINSIKANDPEFYIRLKLTSTGGELFD